MRTSHFISYGVTAAVLGKRLVSTSRAFWSAFNAAGSAVIVCSCSMNAMRSLMFSGVKLAGPGAV